MQSKHIFYSLVIIAAILLTGCGQGTATPAASTSIPVEPTASESPAASAPEDTPSVSAEMGGFHIVLLYMETTRPVRGQNIYLAEMLPLEGGPKGAFVPALDTSTAPSAESSDTGNVSISMVPPGNYALSLLTPQGAILVTDVKTNKEITFEVKAGEVTDLGTRNVFLNPDFLEPGN
jgi:hypothetical protein